jgi:hypothetical protein
VQEETLDCFKQEAHYTEIQVESSNEDVQIAATERFFYILSINVVFQALRQ